jgi:membrane protein
VVLDRVKRRWHAAEDRWPWLAVAAAVQRRFGELQGGYLAGAITLAAFLSIFPLMLVAVAILGFFSTGHPDVAHRVLDALAIPSRGEAATAIRTAIDTAEKSRKAASVVGVAGLLWSGLGLVAALQYAYDSVWQVTGRGLRDKAAGLLWLVGSALLFVGSFALTAAVQFLPAWLAPVEILLGLGLGVAMFLWASKILPNSDIGWRPLLPGAIVGSIGFELLKLLGGIYVPRAVASSSALYGSLGIVFAILAWLFFFGRLVVYSAVTNVVLWERGHGTVTKEIEVPSLPDREKPETTRSGEAIKATSDA